MAVDGNIIFCERPDYITYDDIHELLWKANQHNREEGFVLSTSKMSGHALENRIGTDGYCFVALDGEKLVGTLSLRVVERNKWYAKGRIPDYMLAGVLPEYQGKHILTGLSDLAFRKIIELGYSVVELDTADTNLHAINVYKHLGFQLVGYKPIPNGDHYSVVMVKWLGECPYSSKYINLRFCIKKLLVTARYTHDKKKRFGI